MSVIKVEENKVYANMIFDYCPQELREVIKKEYIEYLNRVVEKIKNELNMDAALFIDIEEFADCVDFEIPITDEGKIINRKDAIYAYGVRNIEEIERQLREYPDKYGL